MKSNLPRLLLLVNQLSAHGGAGAELRLPHILRGWAGKVDLTIATPRTGRRWLQQNGVTARYLDWISADPEGEMFGRVYAKLYPLLYSGIWSVRTLQACGVLGPQANGYDLLYTVGDFFCNTVPAIWLKRKNPRLRWAAAMYHLIKPPRKSKRTSRWIALGSYLFQSFSLKLIHAHADLVVVDNMVLRDEIVEHGFSPSRIAVVDAGLDVSGVISTPRAEGVNYDACFVGRFNRSKGLPELLEVWHLVLERYRQATLLLIGHASPDFVADLSDHVTRLGLSQHVLLRGPVPTESEKLGLMKASKVFISLSFEEGWGRAVAEALACGLPVVVWDLPVYRAIFEDVLVTVPTGDLKACADAIVTLLQDERRRQQLGVRGQGMVTRYDFGEVARRELEVLLRCMSAIHSDLEV